MKDPTIALEENLWSLWSHFGRGSKCSLIDENGIIKFDTPIPTLLKSLKLLNQKEASRLLSSIANKVHAVLRGSVHGKSLKRSS